MNRTALASLTLSIFAASTLAASAGETAYSGAFALQGGTPRVAMHLTVAPGRSPQDGRLDIWATAPHAATPLTAYETVHTKDIHLVVVSDDLGTFMHVHPTLTAGHFVQVLHLPHRALYHIFADVTLAKVGQQVFRFDVPFGGSERTAVTETVPARATRAGPYVVTLTTLGLSATTPTALGVAIAKGGKPATDLTPYLGASAHAVFIHYADWTYLHVHPGSMGAMADMSNMHDAAPPSGPVSPAFTLHVNADEPGAYKCWLEFKGGGVVYAAPFLLRAR